MKPKEERAYLLTNQTYAKQDEAIRMASSCITNFLMTRNQEYLESAAKFIQLAVHANSEVHTN